jgi:hypothetical protein
VCDEEGVLIRTIAEVERVVASGGIGILKSGQLMGISVREQVLIQRPQSNISGKKTQAADIPAGT